MNERVQNSKSPIYKWDMLVVHATILHNNCTIILMCLAFSFLRHVCCYSWNIKEKSFDNECIIPNDETSEEMIKEKGLQKFLAMTIKQKAL